MIEFELRATTKNLDELRDRLQNLPMGEVAAVGERIHRQYYVEEAGPDRAWPGVTASTLRQKKSGSTLRETGAQAGSVTSSASDKEARISSSGPFYNIFHQMGTEKMSARKHVGIRPGDNPKYVKPIKTHLRL